MSFIKQALPSAARLQALTKLRSEVFGTAYNPESLRTGSKVLKARLRGPAMLRYYGQRISGWAGLNAAVPNLELKDVAEETRWVALAIQRLESLLLLCSAAQAIHHRADLRVLSQAHRLGDEAEAWQGHSQEGYIPSYMLVQTIR